MGRNYPRIARDDFIAILERMGLAQRPKKKKGKGSHKTYVGDYMGNFILLPIPDHKYFDHYYLEQLRDQSGLTKDQLYALNQKTAASAQVEYLEELPKPQNEPRQRGRR